MKTTKCIVTLLTLVLLTAGPTQSAESAAKLSETRIACCLVRISSDPAFLPLDFDSLYALLHSPSVGGKAVRDVLGISPDEVHNLIDLEPVQYLGSTLSQPTRSSRQTPPSDVGMDDYDSEMYEDTTEPDEPSAPTSPVSKAKPKTSYSYSSRSSSSRSRSGTSSRGTRTASSAASRTARPRTQSFATERAILLRLAVEIGEGVAKPAAEEFLDAVIDNLQTSLLKAYKDYKSRLIVHFQFADDEAMQTEKDLRKKQDMLRDISGSRVLDRNVILRDISELRGKIELIEMEQASEAVIIDLTAHQIAEIKAEADRTINDDAVTKELTYLWELQMINLKRVEELHKTGTVSESEIAAAREKIARAKIDLAQRRDQLNKSAGGDLIESLNAKLADSSIQRAQAKAYLSAYDRQLTRAEDLLEKADDYELLSIKAEIAKQNLREALVWCDGISRHVRMLQPPSVSVIGGE